MARKPTGRPVGRPSRLDAVLGSAERHIMEADMLPHEYLLRIMQGRPMKVRTTREEIGPDGEVAEVVDTRVAWPDLQMRLKAAIAAAPYYAPRLAVHRVESADPNDPASMTDEEIDRRVEELATKLGWERPKR